MNTQPIFLGRTSSGFAILSEHDYSEDCNCRDCRDEHYQGAADAAESLRTTDWDWGRE